jgi:hypothetical protein
MNGQEPRHRPLIITIIYVLGFIGIVNSIRFIFSPMMNTYGPLFQFCFVVNMILLLAAYIGIWMMKKWGIILRVLSVVFSLVELTAINIGNPASIRFGVIISIIIIAIVFSQFSKMEW